MTDSTDNARGPERIWVCPDLIVEDNGEKTPDWSCGTFWEGDEPDYPHGQFYVRDDLTPDPLADPRVVGLLEALKHIDALDPEGMINGCSQSALTGLVLRMGETARAALAALSPTGGNDE